MTGQDLGRCARWCRELWRSLSYPVRVVTLLSVLFTSLAAMVSAVPTAINAADPIFPATRGWTREFVMSEYKNIRQLSIVNSRRFNRQDRTAAKDQLDDYRIKLKNNPSRDAVPLITDKIKSLKRDIDRLDGEYRKLLQFDG